MTLDNYTDGNDAVDEPNENDLIRSLRKQIKEKDAELKARPDRATLEAELLAGLARKSAISEQLIALGHPAGMSEFLNGQLGEVEVTRESVANALQGIGYKIEVDGAAQEQAIEAQANQSDLVNVATLSSQIGSITQAGRVDGVAEVNATNSPEELREYMARQGLLAEG